MSTGRSIDHIVLAVDNLDKAAEHYQALGFTLTPRAAHEDRMGTSNRLAQFSGQNFIEILEVDRPRLLDDHQPAADPPQFSFGAFNRSFVQQRNGIAMLVFTSTDARSDIEHFHRQDLQTYAPFDFERQATLPDGAQVTVAFSLGFVTSPKMPELAFFICQQHAPQYFWKTEFQHHDNGAQSIAAVYIAADNPAAHGDFLGKLFGGSVTNTDGGIRVSCGDDQEIFVLTPQQIELIAPGTAITTAAGPRAAGIALRSTAGKSQLITADQACGMFIVQQP